MNSRLRRPTGDRSSSSAPGTRSFGVYRQAVNPSSHSFSLPSLPTSLHTADRVDRDGSGSIDVGELEQLLNLAGVYPTAAELDILYRRFDKDADGSISFEEFIGAMVEDWEEQELEEEFTEIREIFSLLDKDGSRRLSVEELKALMGKLGVADVDDRVVLKLYEGMKQTGIRGESIDDGVSLDEFAAFLLSQDDQGRR